MIYGNTQELLELLKREHLWAQKKLGQNFLVNPEALKNIVNAAELTKEDDVMEIGPGLGILTEQLAAHAGKITCIELDAAIIPVLKKNLGRAAEGPYANITILHRNALKIELPVHPYKLVANIPYYITSPILNHFLQPKTPSQRRPSLIVLFVQKEVAQKICAGPDDQTILSLEVQAFGKPSIVCNVGKGSFFPQPKVDSAVIKIQTYPKPRISNVEIFFRLLKAAFSQRRKTLSNSLRNGLGLNASQMGTLFHESGVAPNERPQKISLEEWQALIQAYEKILG